MALLDAPTANDTSKCKLYVNAVNFVKMSLLVQFQEPTTKWITWALDGSKEPVEPKTPIFLKMA